MDILIDRVKKILIISTAIFVLYSCDLNTQITSIYAPITVEPPSALIQADLDVINTYFQEQKIVVKIRMYSKPFDLICESEYNRAGQEIKEIFYVDCSVDGWTETEYGEDGQKSAWISYDGDGNVIFHKEYKYDDAGHTIELTDYDSSGNITDKLTYIYDEDGNCIEDTQYNSSDNITYKSTYAYDEEGNRIEGVQYYGDDIYRRYECEYEYVEAGKREKRVEYNGDGDILFYGEYEYEYDEAGYVIKEEYHETADAADDYYRTYKYRYNEAGGVEKSIKYDEDGNVLFWVEYQYDEAGNLLSKITCNDGIYGRREYRYGKNGEIIKETRLVDGEIINQREYEYDEWGNLTDDGSYTYDYVYETVYTSRQPVMVYKKEYRDGTLTCQTEYDRTGKEIAKIIYDRDGNISEQIVYTYDEVGNLIEMSGVRQDNGIIKPQKSAYKQTYTYNEADDMTGCELSFNDELSTRWEYEYDKTGKLKSCTAYTKNGDITVYREHEYEYDETGNVISDTAQVYNTIMTDIETERFDTTQEKYEYEYDEAGRKEKEICYMDGRMDSWLEWEYDEKGRILVETEYSVYDGSITAQDKYEYDVDGKKVKKIRTKYGSSKEEIVEEEITKYSHDTHGNIIEERTGERSITYEYIYE